MFIEPHFDDLDRLALEIATDDRFRPGTLNRAPVPVLASLEALIKRSILDSADAGGKPGQILGLRELAGQTLGRPWAGPGEPKVKTIFAGSSQVLKVQRIQTSPPVWLSTQWRRRIRPRPSRMHIPGGCIAAVIVDEHGMRKNPRVEKGLEPRMHQNALIALAELSEEARKNHFLGTVLIGAVVDRAGMLWDVRISSLPGVWPR